MYLGMCLDYTDNWLAHPFFSRGIERTKISRKIQIFVITGHNPGTNGLNLLTKSMRGVILTIWDQPNQYKGNPFFSMGRKSLQNPDFQILRKNRKSNYYCNFSTKQGSGNSIKVKYESWLPRNEFQSFFEKSRKSAKIKILKKCSRTQPLRPGLTETS